MTNQEVADYVENEGLGYAVSEGLASSSIGDPELQKQWEIADKAMAEIDSILAPYRS